MDYNVINTTISKAFYKETKILLGSYDNTVGVTVDGFVMWFIPENEFLFDKNKLLNGKYETDIQRYLKTKGYIDATLSPLKMSQEKKTLRILENNNVKVYVDEKLLKTFDLKIASFKILNPLSGVLVYEGDTLVGFVMPTRYNENKQ